MNVIVCILIILTLSVITFLQASKKDSSMKKRIAGTELDYLYAYHELLLKVKEVEAEFKTIDKNYSKGATSYFTSIEIVQLKQNAQKTITNLLDNFRQGYISYTAAKNQLDDLSKKMHILFTEAA